MSDEENFASEKYKECWEPANKWLNAHAPDFVIEQLEELNKYIKHLQSIIEDRDQYIAMVERVAGSQLATKEILSQDGGGRTMTIENGAMQICDHEQAQGFGFVIEGEVAFIWDIGNKSMVCLGYVDGGWQADITDEESFAYQRRDASLTHMIDICQAMADTSHSLKKVDEVDLHKLFDMYHFEQIQEIVMDFIQQNNLIAYLEECGGTDRHEFWLDDGKPDLDSARKFCLTMRDQVAGIECIKVTQSNNVVRIATTSEALVND